MKNVKIIGGVLNFLKSNPVVLSMKFFISKSTWKARGKTQSVQIAGDWEMLGQDKLLLHMATVQCHIASVAGSAGRVDVGGCGT